MRFPFINHIQGCLWVLQTMHTLPTSCKLSRKGMMHLTHIIVVDIFDAWGINFMRLFPNSCWNKYICVCVDYAPKWVRTISTRTNESWLVGRLIAENIFARYRMPRVIISDQWTYFYNRFFHAPLGTYSIIHLLASPYRRQTNGQ